MPNTKPDLFALVTGVIAVLFVTCTLHGCSGELSDDELAMAAYLCADSLIANGYCPAKKRDSLATEMTILLFRRANRAEGLIGIMKDTPELKSNSAAQYGLAIGYAMLEEEANARQHLDAAVALGDWHLYLDDERAKFQIFADDPLFQDLVYESESNHDRMMLIAGMDAVKVRKRRQSVEEGQQYKGR